MRRSKTTILICLVILTVCIGAAALRGVPRWLVLRKVMTSPERTAALSVVPEPRILLTQEHVPDGLPHSVGYAQFLLPGDESMELSYSASGPLLKGQSDGLCLWFMPVTEIDTEDLLAAIYKIDGIASQTDLEWLTERILNPPAHPTSPKTNLVDAQMLAVEAVPLPFWDILMMPNAKFRSYLIKLAMKNLLMPLRAQQIIPYESETTEGLVYLEENGSDGIIELTTHDRAISQTISFEIMDADSEASLRPILDFVASYSFTME
jgi:hypothetical protein